MAAIFAKLCLASLYGESLKQLDSLFWLLRMGSEDNRADFHPGIIALLVWSHDRLRQRRFSLFEASGLGGVDGCSITDFGIDSLKCRGMV